MINLAATNFTEAEDIELLHFNKNGFVNVVTRDNMIVTTAIRVVKWVILQHLVARWALLTTVEYYLA